MYDQVGGGFARYAVDARWVIPHFEKMLYDNALLARAYLHGHQVSGEPFFLRVCTETLDWALRDLRQDEGGFASSLDADSDGEEGASTSGRPTRCGPRSATTSWPRTALSYFGMTGEPNFEGRGRRCAPRRIRRGSARSRSACGPRASSVSGRRSTTSG